MLWLLAKYDIMKFKTIYFLFVLIFIWGCSTKKNTWLSRNYHDLTAHYNVYFNGNESFKEGVKAIEEGNIDDYTQVLVVFPDSKEASKDVAISEMDRAIEKGTKLIKKHSITKKPKRKKGDNSIKYQKFVSQNEFNKWVDNAYLLIGKSNFYKHDYHLAQQSFEYMFREFRTGPEWYEAEIWNARAAIELGDFAKAKIILDNYDIEGKAPDRFYGLFSAVYADYYLRQQKYEEAVPYLQKAITGSWSRYYKLRLNFIIAQVYHKLHRYNDASMAYKNVIRMNPQYEMAFNAKVNRASVMFGEGGLPAVQKEITKLLRDKRNQEYEDQIYYALAMAYLAEKQEENAVDNLLTSVSKSVSNNYQKGLSFNQLAEIYYQKPEYKPAYAYLDSALYSFDEDFYKYDEISDLHDDLEGLVTRILTVEREDSLQRIAKMNESQRFAFIDNLIEQEKKRQEELKKQEEEQDGDFYFSNSQTSTSSASNSGKWYFYNPNSVALGKSEFERKWGRRKLEDNWRRANKEVVVTEISDPGNPDDLFGEPFPEGADSLGLSKDSMKVNADKINLLSRDTYIKGLPLTQEQLTLSNQKIEEALIMMGIIYKDEIENIPYAIEAFNELIKRFPYSNYIEDALMNLYLCYEIEDDQLNMARIKKQIIEQYPDGEFTAFLNDPDYFKKREEKLKQIEKLYEEAYTAYLFNQFETPILNYNKAKTLDEENVLLPKFKFLSGLAYAKTGNLSGFSSELKDVVKTYPDAEVTPLAKEMLAMFDEGRTPVQGPVSTHLNDVRNKELQLEKQQRGVVDSSDAAANAFVVNNRNVHSLILIVNPEADINRLRFNIADYNFSKFLLNDYEMTDLNLPDRTPIFAINGFNNRLEALDYFYALRERQDVFKVDNLERYQLFVINEGNLEFLLSSGDVTGYESFFEENYLSAEAFKNVEKEKTVEKEESGVQEKELEIQEEQKEGVADKKLAVQSTVKQLESPQESKESRASIAKQQEKELEKSPVEELKEVKSSLDVKVFEVNAKEEQKELQEQKEEAIIEKQPVNHFVYEDGAHSAVILFKKGRINIQRTGTIFKNYSKANFGSHLEAEYGPKETAWLYIKVNGFATAKEAKEYVQKVRLDNYLMREISRMKYYTWVITENNYQRLTNEELYEKYEDFYKLNY